jgi:3,4-dihydroxy 2-butanone 4-phosphate synthase
MLYPSFYLFYPPKYILKTQRIEMEKSLLGKFGKTSHERVLNAVSCFKKGIGVLLVDDEDRENEGDIIFPAKTITEKQMALLIRECSGIVCLCLEETHLNKLKLPQMVTDNTSTNKTAFTVSIEAAKGVTTGVSAKDRVRTIKAAINDDAKPEDLNRPGHVFPLKAHPKGILGRRGHTEGSVLLAKLAGFGPAAVLCELTNKDGSMARLREICKFAKKHKYSVVTIDDLVKNISEL